MLDRVVCRECFAILCDDVMDGKTGHLMTNHQLSLKQFRLRNPGARVHTFESIAKQESQRLKIERSPLEYVANDLADYASPEEREAARKDRFYEQSHGATTYGYWTVNGQARRCLEVLSATIGFGQIFREDGHSWLAVLCTAFRPDQSNHRPCGRKQAEREHSILENCLAK